MIKVRIGDNTKNERVCEIIGQEFLPCIIKDLNDDNATIVMVESNNAREKILPSEKGKSYKMMLNAMKRKSGRRRKVNLSPMETDL